MNAFKSAPSNFRRKLKYFLIAASAVFVLFIAGVVWVGYGVVNYASNVQISPTVNAVANSSCWVKAQALVSTEAFLSVPLAQQIASIRKACFEEPLGQASSATAPVEAVDSEKPREANDW